MIYRICILFQSYYFAFILHRVEVGVMILCNVMRLMLCHHSHFTTAKAAVSVEIELMYISASQKV